MRGSQHHEIENFAAGIHTYPSRKGDRKYWARDMGNLRSDADGFLRPVVGYADSFTAKGEVTGIAKAKDWLLYLVGNSLYGRKGPLGGEVLLLERSELGGRLSVVDEPPDFAVLTSEGEDQGYWFEYGTQRVRQLGFNPPGTVRTEGFIFRRDELLGTGLTADKYYAYRTTYYRDGGNNPLFAGIESEPSDAVVVGPVPERANNRAGVRLTDLHFPDDDWDVYEDVNRIRVYRSTPMNNADDLPVDYRLVGLIEIGAGQRQVTGEPRVEVIFGHVVELPIIEIGHIGQTYTFDDFSGDGTQQNQEGIPEDNTRMPSSCKALAYFNGTLFGACGTELRFSDTRGGNFELWAWPATNSVHADRVDSVFEYDGVLLFGYKRGLWRLVGDNIHNYDNDSISGVGPIDGYSIRELENGVGFVGESGLFVTGGSDVRRIGNPELDRFFERSQVVSGSLLLFPNGMVLWSLEVVGGQ